MLKVGLIVGIFLLATGQKLPEEDKPGSRTDRFHTASFSSTKRLESQLQEALHVVELSINTIYDRWKVGEYPKFLKSCFMHKSSWDLMKLKFVSKIIAAHEQQHTLSGQENKHELSSSPVSFVMSFLGSSVAAGHDSFFNQSYPVLVGQTMKPVFDALGIQLVSRNVALGNNPCMPYDICVKIFAGLDADIVQWEQTYNCGDSPILEQFVRQAMMIPTKPIVVFSESSTFNWQPEKCEPLPPQHIVTTKERDLLHALPVSRSAVRIVVVESTHPINTYYLSLF